MWSPDKFTTAQRVAAAKEIARRLADKYGSNLIAVAIEGSTAKGLDLPESDLELAVIIQGVADRWYPFFYNGLSVGISYGNPEAELEDAARIDYTWPVTGDAYQTAQVIYDPGSFYPKLCHAASEAEEGTDFAPLIRDALADVYENVLKVFSLGSKQTMAAVMFAANAAYWAALTVALVNKHKYRSTRAMFQESTELPQLPEGYAQGIGHLLCQGQDVESLQGTLGRFWPSLRAWVDDMGIHMQDNCLEHIF